MHREWHRSDRIGWLRATVLGANDGLISTSSLVVGVAAADPSRAAILLAAVAGLAAGALSMAAGEYVSVSSQADTEQADLAREQGELATNTAQDPASSRHFCALRPMRTPWVPLPRHSHHSHRPPKVETQGRPHGVPPPTRPAGAPAVRAAAGRISVQWEADAAATATGLQFTGTS